MTTATITESMLTRERILRLFPDVAANDVEKPDNQSGPELEGYDEEQVRLMEEVCIVLDWNDVPCGSASKKTCHLMTNIDSGLLHRAFSVFLFNDENKLLLQQRADEKITFPGMWTNTCCSHPLSIPGEIGHDLPTSIMGVKRAAQRKLDQELGIPGSEVPVDNFHFLTRIHYKAPSDGIWGEHEIDYILFIKSTPSVAANPNEVKDTKYVTADELKAMFKDDSLTFTPWFKLICETYLFGWWSDIDNVTSFHEDSIRRLL
ncbi:isopentenyl diphosphate isomerase [Myxozyma melibiosi]|uniref:isopentenyl-diphosphate Delta-isomerase n=1 Tax=Myxozyma melibiosi TaxID=54550 RepID=A0ABR1EYW2_9ASCO